MHVSRRTVRASASALGVALLLISSQSVRVDAQQGPVNVGPRWVCRAADADHAANASTTRGKMQASLHCTPINLTLTTSSGRVLVIGSPQASAPNAGQEQISLTSPTYSGSMTATDLNSGWVDTMKKGLAVDEGTGGTVAVGDRWVCRPVDATHPQNSVTTSGTPTPLSCRAVNLSMRLSSGQTIVIGHTHAMPKSDTNDETAEIAPPSTAGLTVQQQNASWNASVYRAFNIADSAA